MNKQIVSAEQKWTSAQDQPLLSFTSAKICRLHVTSCGGFRTQQVGVVIGAELQQELWPQVLRFKGHSVYLPIGAMLRTYATFIETLDSALRRTNPSDKIVQVYE